VEKVSAKNEAVSNNVRCKLLHLTAADTAAAAAAAAAVAADTNSASDGYIHGSKPT